MTVAVLNVYSVRIAQPINHALKINALTLVQEYVEQTQSVTLLIMFLAVPVWKDSREILLNSARKILSFKHLSHVNRRLVVLTVFAEKMEGWPHASVFQIIQVHLQTVAQSVLWVVNVHRTELAIGWNVLTLAEVFVV